MQTAPPGWYPDDTGTRRYWDGSRWAPLVPTRSRQWALAAHLSAIVAMVIGFAFVGPLIVYLVKGGEDPYVREHAREALNFQLSALLYGVVGGLVLLVLFLLFIGILLIPFAIAAVIAWFVVIVQAAMRANEGRPYRYPVTIRFFS